MPQKKKKKAASKKRDNYVLVVHKKKRFMFTKTEYNRAFLRAKKRSGLG